MKKLYFPAAGIVLWELGIQGFILDVVVDLVWDLGQVT